MRMKKISEIKVSYSSSSSDRIILRNSENVWKTALSNWNLDIIEFQEEVKLILLNRANVVLGIYDVSKGGTTSSIIDLKIVLAIALKCNAHGLILLHNHPSGNLKPSIMDKRLTEKLKQACKIVDLTLLDHLIITKESYFSFADNGML